MVAKETPQGLIATVHVAITPALVNVAACCDWPLLLDATPRQLSREVEQINPDCVLFWVEDAQAVEPTARLITWARRRGARPLRVAAALEMDASLEATLRSAGAHGFIAVTETSTQLVAAALRSLLQPTGAERRGSPAVAARAAPDLVRPP